MATGFTITTNETCLGEQFPALNLTYGGIYVYANSSIDESKLPVDSGCFLNSTGVATISFEDCGDITPVNNATNDYTQFTSYIHQAINITGDWINLFDPIAIECQIGHAELETYSVNRTVVEQQQVNSVVSSQTLVDDFNLELVVA